MSDTQYPAGHVACKANARHSMMSPSTVFHLYCCTANFQLPLGLEVPNVMLEGHLPIALIVPQMVPALTVRCTLRTELIKAVVSQDTSQQMLLAVLSQSLLQDRAMHGLLHMLDFLHAVASQQARLGPDLPAMQFHLPAIQVIRSIQGQSSTNWQAGAVPGLFRYTQSRVQVCDAVAIPATHAGLLSLGSQNSAKVLTLALPAKDKSIAGPVWSTW